jgi:hypothetical protein
MPIGTIETINVMLRKLVYGRADGMPNSLESMVVCDYSSSTVAYKGCSVEKTRAFKVIFLS